MTHEFVTAASHHCNAAPREEREKRFTRARPSVDVVVDGDVNDPKVVAVAVNVAVNG